MKVHVVTDSGGHVAGVYTRQRAALALQEKLVREGIPYVIVHTDIELNEEQDVGTQDEG